MVQSHRNYFMAGHLFKRAVDNGQRFELEVAWPNISFNRFQQIIGDVIFENLRGMDLTTDTWSGKLGIEGRLVGQAR
jgi:hypothetical protein